MLDTGEPVEYELSVSFPETGTEATFSTQQYP